AILWDFAMGWGSSPGGIGARTLRTLTPAGKPKVRLERCPRFPVASPFATLDHPKDAPVGTSRRAPTKDHQPTRITSSFILHPSPMPSENLLQRVFDKIDDDYDFLLDSLAEVLRSTGEGDLAACLPHVRAGSGGDRTAIDPRREIQVLSCAFQLLNLVEENAAAQIRRIQETQQGPEREPGLWAHSLAQLRECGISGEQIAGALRDIEIGRAS